uniref:Cytosolic carboxypeptidase 2 n=1 Tax=Macrostomum lignano TaxID=282301 RepID=A0A1I8I3A9_9PLAT
KNEKRIKDLEGWESDSTPDYKEYGSDDDYLNEALKDKVSMNLAKTRNSSESLHCTPQVTKLKEPRALFSGAQDAGLQPAKWCIICRILLKRESNNFHALLFPNSRPIEMEVLPDRVLHVDCPPEVPEPFGSSAAFEPTPVVQGEDSSSESSRLVFKYEPVLSPFFIKSRAGGSRTLSVCQIRDGQSDDSLVFESRFESGNLRRAYRVGPRDYELWLRTDLYTSKHTQWFYFRVSNTEPGQAYRFTLVNFYKSASLYNEGLRPLMYSCRAAKLRGAGWRRCGSGIKYFKSNQRYTAANGSEKFYYSLTWQTRFEFLDDTVYFAHCYPYTYSDLLDYLQSLQADPVVSGFCKQRVLCRSLAGNAVHLLTIGTPEEPPKGGAKPQQQQQSRKPVILVTSRVHPGESNASWMMKGFLDHLTGQHPDACLLRDCFTFKVVPMINPDGVIVGNYRCSLAGRDLNRNYRSPLRDSFPAVCAIVDLVSRLQARGVRVALYCDLHGHSRRQNVFMYGCAPDKSLPVSERLSERVFPAMMSRNAPDKFEQDSCKFRMQKSKEGTGRIVMYRLGIRCAYTMEATFCGSTLGGLAGFHFTCRHLEQMGAHLCDSMLDYFDPSGAKRDRILSELERRLRVQILINLQRSGLAAGLSDPEQLDLANLPDIVAADGSAADDPEEVGDSSDDGGSDSSVSDGLPAHFEFMRKAGGPAGGRGVGASGRRKKRRSRKELAAAAGAVAQRRVSKVTARCPHSQQPTGDKSVPSAPGSRQKSRASQQASRGDAITMATTPTTSGQQPQPGRIRSAVTVERLDEGL